MSFSKKYDLLSALLLLKTEDKKANFKRRQLYFITSCNNLNTNKIKLEASNSHRIWSIYSAVFSIIQKDTHGPSLEDCRIRFYFVIIYLRIKKFHFVPNEAE